MVNIINKLQYCQHCQQLLISSTLSTNRVKCVDAVERLQNRSCICRLRCPTRCRAREEIARRKFGTKLLKWCHILLAHPSDLGGRCGKHYLQCVMWGGVGCSPNAERKDVTKTFLEMGGACANRRKHTCVFLTLLFSDAIQPGVSSRSAYDELPHKREMKKVRQIQINTYCLQIVFDVFPHACCTSDWQQGLILHKMQLLWVM